MVELLAKMMDFGTNNLGKDMEDGPVLIYDQLRKIWGWVFYHSLVTFIVPIQDGVVSLSVTPRPVIIIELVSKLCYTQNIDRKIQEIENVFHL